MSRFRDIVNKILIEYVFEEDAFSDRQLYRDAIDVYMEVLNTIEKRVAQDPEKIITDVNSICSLDLNVNEQSLRVCFDFSDEEDSKGVYFPEQKVILLNLGNIFELDEFGIRMTDPITGEENVIGLKANMFNKLASSVHTQNTFIHEYTHFIDDTTKFAINKQADNKKNKNADYVNKDYERNAWYIAWLNKAVLNLFNKYGKAMRDLTPEERLNFVKETCWKDEEFVTYYNALTPENKKRFIGRLYNYFSTDFWINNAA